MSTLMLIWSSIHWSGRLWRFCKVIRTSINNWLTKPRNWLWISAYTGYFMPFSWCFISITDVWSVFWMFGQYILLSGWIFLKMDSWLIQSMIELLQVHDFNIEQSESKFLPYNMVRVKERPLFLVSLYLRFSFLWKIFGKQFFIVAKK